MMRVLKYLLLIVFLASYSSLVLSSMQSSVKLSLVDQMGQPFDIQQLQGNVVLLAFGYTSCPDVCPMEVSVMARVLKTLSAQDYPVKAVFVSVDTERDTPQVLRSYLEYFHADITGITGSREGIDNIVQRFHANYQIERSNDGSVSVEHSSHLFVLNQQGVIDTMVPFGMNTNHVIKVVERLLENRNNSKEEIK